MIKISEESKLLLQEYAKNPVNNYQMKNPTILQHEGNFVCGDDITIYIKIKKEKIIDFSFDGNCSTITTAAASFLAEQIIGQKLDTLLTRNYNIIQKQGLEVSRRRKRSAVIALLAVQNAIYKYRKQDINKEIEDLIEE